MRTSRTNTLAQLAEADAVKTATEDGLGDARLTWWEQNFLKSLRHTTLLPDGEPNPEARRLSHKQAEVLKRIQAKLDREPEGNDEAGDGFKANGRYYDAP